MLSTRCRIVDNSDSKKIIYKLKKKIIGFIDIGSKNMRGHYTQNECQKRNRWELLVRSTKHVLLHAIHAILVKIGSCNIPNNNFEYVRLFVLPLNRVF